MSSTSVTGRVWVVDDSVTTDAMYPPDAMKLDLPEAARFVFHDLRPGWTDQVQPGDIVVAGRNFGLGSSRPVAALFNELGVAALVAEDFNSLFYRNAVNAGLPAMAAPGVRAAFEDGDVGTFDLEAGTWTNDTSGRHGTTAPTPPLLLEIIASGGVLPRLAEQGYLPAELADLLRSSAVQAQSQGSGA